MKLMKVAMFVMTCGICTSAFAQSNWYDNWYHNAPWCGTGPYIGIQGGYGSADYGSGIKNAYNGYANHSNDEDDIAGRAYVGYQMTPIFGLEAGYSLFSDNEYKGSNVGGTVYSKTKLETQAVDLMATLGTPLFYHGFGVKVKGGAAYIMSHYDQTGNGSDASYRPEHHNNDRFAPAAGASLIYNLPNNIAVDLSYMRIFAPAHIDTPETDLVTLGVSYRFDV